MEGGVGGEAESLLTESVRAARAREFCTLELHGNANLEGKRV